MSRWTAIEEDHLRAGAHGAILDQARATAAGGLDPVEEEIGNAVARVRRAVSTGNVLDADAGKVPNSLKGVTVRIAVYALMERIGLPLSPDQQTKAKDITSDLNRIADNKTKVEAPDTPASSAEMQATGGAVEAVGVPRRQTGRERTSGL